jgi:hypothetical protein
MYLEPELTVDLLGHKLHSHLRGGWDSVADVIKSNQIKPKLPSKDQRRPCSGRQDQQLD